MKTIFFRPRVVSLLTQSVERNARETIVTTRMNERSEEREYTPLTDIWSTRSLLSVTVP